MINLAGHCDPYSNGCTGLSLDIKPCQTKGIKVMLSIGGGAGGYYLASKDNARQVAIYLWNNFLGGNRLLIHLVQLFWMALTLLLKEEQTNIGTISPDTFLDIARKARRCTYLQLPNAHSLMLGLEVPLRLVFFTMFGFNSTTTRLANTLQGMLETLKMHGSSGLQIFLGLPAAPDAAGSGFIPVDDLKSTVVPAIKDSGKFGGVMLWSKYYDDQTGYSTSIKSNV